MLVSRSRWAVACGLLALGPDGQLYVVEAGRGGAPTGAPATGPHDIDFGFKAAFITVGSGGDRPYHAAGI